jgi:F-type H+-transporting ATPase subunit epsilon
MSDLQCVIVTPERTEVDVRAQSVTVPLFDGELGILKNHSPLVGRLGFGLLRVTGSDGSVTSYFVEGGFVQVAQNVVSVLTDRVAPREKITREAADHAMKAAHDMPGDSPDQVALRDRAKVRARALQRVAR